MARQAVVAEGDPSVLDSQRRQVDDALRLADLWLGDATTLPSGIRSTQAWSRSEWVEATLPVWSKLCDPIAAKAVETMGGMFTLDPDELGDLPPEMRTAMSAVGGGLGGLAPMMQQIGGAMVGGQTGAAVGALAREVVSSTDIGLPLGPEGTAALLPAGSPSSAAGSRSMTGRCGCSSRCARRPISGCSPTCRGCGAACWARWRSTRAA